MKWISNINNISSLLFFIIIAFLSIKIPMMILDMKYLPDVTKSVVLDNTDYYKRFDFLNGLELAVPQRDKSVKTQVPKIVSHRTIQQSKQPSLYNMNLIKLRTVYIEKNNSFVAFVDDDDLQIVNLGQIYKGYTLSEVTKSYVVFSGSKDYKLFLEDDAESNNIQPVTKHQKKKTIQHQTRKKVKKEQPLHDVEIPKSDIKQYLNGSRDILRDIAFSPYKQSGKLIGYKVKRIRASSPLANFGLKKGDIITEVNGRSMSKMSNLMYFYSQRNSLDRLSIIYLRNGNEQEINYEIR